MNKYPKKYLEYIRSSIGSDKYKNHFIIKDGNLFDALQDGKFSCAKFVSSVLKEFKMIEKIHAKVKSAQKDMIEFGWKEVDLNNIKRGDVIIWERNQKGNLHIGFYIGKYRAISNSTAKRVIWKHHYRYRGKRKIVTILSLIKRD